MPYKFAHEEESINVPSRQQMSHPRRAITALIVASIVGWFLSPFIADLMTFSITGSRGAGSATQTVMDRLWFSVSFGFMIALAPLASSWSRHQKLPLLTHALCYFGVAFGACAVAMALGCYQIASSGLPISGPSDSGISDTFIIAHVHVGPLPMIGIAAAVTVAFVLRTVGSRLSSESQ